MSERTLDSIRISHGNAHSIQRLRECSHDSLVSIADSRHEDRGQLLEIVDTLRANLARYDRADVGEVVREIEGFQALDTGPAAKDFPLTGSTHRCLQHRGTLLAIVRQQQAEIERLRGDILSNQQSAEMVQAERDARHRGEIEALRAERDEWLERAGNYADDVAQAGMHSDKLRRRAAAWKRCAKRLRAANASLADDAKDAQNGQRDALEDLTEAQNRLHEVRQDHNKLATELALVCSHNKDLHEENTRLVADVREAEKRHQVAAVARDEARAEIERAKDFYDVSFRAWRLRFEQFAAKANLAETDRDNLKRELVDARVAIGELETERNSLRAVVKSYEEADTGPVGRVEADRDVRLNLNDYVTVELTERGKQVLVVNEPAIRKHSKWRYTDSFIRLQFWEFISIFGAERCWYNGANPVCNMNVTVHRTDSEPSTAATPPPVGAAGGEEHRPGLPPLALREVCDRWEAVNSEYLFFDPTGATYTWRHPIHLGAKGIHSASEFPAAALIRPRGKTWPSVETEAAARLGRLDAEAGRERMSLEALAAALGVSAPVSSALNGEYHAAYSDAIPWRTERPAGSLPPGCVWRRHDMSASDWWKAFDAQGLPVPWQRVGG